MKHIVLLFSLLIFAVSLVSAQPKETLLTYKTESNIPYRSGENLEQYMKERCKLDIYVPENADSFTTVIWFHGGGLTSGEKTFPERLKNHKLAVVTNLFIRIRWI